MTTAPSPNPSAEFIEETSRDISEELLWADSLAGAEQFLWKHGRLLERHLFETLFRDASPQPALAALAAYQNDDGGFGHALQPDLRGPTSQPVAVDLAFSVLDALGAFDSVIVDKALEFLSSITRLDGGVPVALPTVADFPCARTWRGVDTTTACLNPTASLVALLRKHGREHPWIDEAEDFCWQAIGAYASWAETPLAPELRPPGYYTLRPAIAFLEHADDPLRAEQLLERLGEVILEWDLVGFGPASSESLPGPLGWAPVAESSCRKLFTPELIGRHLDWLRWSQQDDGGWPAGRKASSPAAETEWRSIRTVEALRTLDSYGRLQPELPF
jgi:hypothetical protein